MKIEALFAVLVIAGLGGGGALAQAADDARVAKLEETVRQLEQRVAALEGRVQGTSASASVPADKVNWRKLKNGMSEAAVEQILGSPTKVESSQFLTVWYYGELLSGGKVTFDTKSQTVSGWREP